MGHTLFLMMEEVQKIGIEIRPDIMHYVNLGSVAALAELDILTQQRVAKRTDDLSKSLLRDLNPHDPRHGLYVMAMFILKLVDEGLIHDKNNQAVLASLLLIEDLKEVNETSTWTFEEARLKKEALHLLTRARLLGVYNKVIN